VRFEPGEIFAEGGQVSTVGVH